jgi:hypothetical protein
MSKQIIYTLLWMVLAACNMPQVPKPEWVNRVEYLSIPAEKIVFKAPGNEWEAVLLSFTQPVPLQLSYTDSGFMVSQANQSGITEGKAQIVLTYKDQVFFYPVTLINKESGHISEKDYRSPKTVNPDSSLNQQSLQHAIDQWQNLVSTPQNPEYFKEFMLGLNPITGTFRARKEEAITAFYVQPGSCTSIPLQAVYREEKSAFNVTAGPLKDAFGNTVANGTMVKFLYKKTNTTWQMESVLQNGFTTVLIPTVKGEQITLTAFVQQTQSPTLTLNAE